MVGLLLFQYGLRGFRNSLTRDLTRDLLGIFPRIG
jgi:hypothetical protein